MSLFHYFLNLANISWYNTVGTKFGQDCFDWLLEWLMNKLLMMDKQTKYIGPWTSMDPQDSKNNKQHIMYKPLHKTKKHSPVNSSNCDYPCSKHCELYPNTISNHFLHWHKARSQITLGQQLNNGTINPTTAQQHYSLYNTTHMYIFPHIYLSRQ